MGRARIRNKPTPVQLELEVESIDLEGNGVAHHEGKVYFVEGALTGEHVLAEITRDKVRYARAKTVSVLRAASARVKPKCPNFGTCGGCSLQHMAPNLQIASKARVLEDALKRIGQQKPEQMLAPISGVFWGYRHRARLSCKFVLKKNQMMVGFHEKHAPYVVNLNECLVFPPKMSLLLNPLKRLIESMEARDHLPQLEVAIGKGEIAIALRHMVALSTNDIKRLTDFAQKHEIDWWLQPAGPETVHRLQASSPIELCYDIPSFGITMHFKPTDFTQINHQINDVLVQRAVSLMQVQADDKVLDLFCGLGNFSLPLAKSCFQVKGLEGSEDLVKRATENAIRNGLADQTEFVQRDLFEVDAKEWESWGFYNRVLIDPPRDGAYAICKAIAEAHQDFKPVRIVYVSCNPATLARDVKVLCENGDYKLSLAGIINMFPHTGHVESIAVLDKKCP